ncbi:spore germination protein GerPE [Robertmurraya andreesenii]|uniref:Spore germination protein PE n=1 Tax=Anoxybacillus andreesenii TaxID=1325932 RepID=A0ABT9UYQ9_9BACL|nr:spore germination protein GerPE [Robertmurraya andreesenii]MDQ0153832.1 spore germination protein PE [Robertmurraya andreesenii]
MYQKRTSIVNSLSVNVITIVSTLEIGDSAHIHGTTRALAVQREKELFFGNEGNFLGYGLFNKPILLEAVTEPLTYEREVLSPFIKVNNITINAISTSSVAHIGNTKSVNMEARIKHIRQLEPRER